MPEGRSRGHSIFFSSNKSSADLGGEERETPGVKGLEE